MEQAVVSDHAWAAAEASPSAAVVYIIDDDVSVRESLELLLRTEGWQVMSFRRARDFLEEQRVRTPSCLILDVNLPDLSGLDLQGQVADARPEMPIIFITGYGDIPTAVEAMKAGAVEFLQKPFGDEVLVAAIRRALVRSDAVLEDEREAEELRLLYGSLSNREREVMELIVVGLLNKQVGGELGISEITVKAHRGRVMRKMGAKSFADLVKKAAKLGLPTGAGTARSR